MLVQKYNLFNSIHNMGARLANIILGYGYLVNLDYVQTRQ